MGDDSACGHVRDSALEVVRRLEQVGGRVLAYQLCVCAHACVCV